MWASAPTLKYGNACEFAERLSEMRRPPLAAPRAGRGGGIFEENDGGDLLQDSECSGICGVRIPSGPSGQLPLCPRGAFVGADAHIGPRRKRRFYGNLRRIRNFREGRCGHRPLH